MLEKVNGNNCEQIFCIIFFRLFLGVALHLDFSSEVFLFSMWFSVSAMNRVLFSIRKKTTIVFL